MAFTKAISNIIKGAVTNKILGELTSNFADQGQTKKLAAKIADKSPLDIDLANNAHMRADNNPFKYGLLYYPQETQNLGDGHYIIFDIIMNSLSSFERQTFDSRGKLVEENFNRYGRSNDIEPYRLYINVILARSHTNGNTDGVYIETYAGMGCVLYVKATLNNPIMTFFLHSDNMGQYGEATNHIPLRDRFLGNAINVADISREHFLLLNEQPFAVNDIGVIHNT